MGIPASELDVKVRVPTRVIPTERACEQLTEESTTVLTACRK